jgi:hypothetical protein
MIFEFDGAGNKIATSDAQYYTDSGVALFLPINDRRWLNNPSRSILPG